MNNVREYFESLRDRTLKSLKPGEHLFISFAAEQSQFVRVNAAKVRQIGTVEEMSLELTLLLESSDGAIRKASRGMSLSGSPDYDWDAVQSSLGSLRLEVPGLPVDPYAEKPANHGSSSSEKKGAILAPADATDALLSGIGAIDLAGIYAGGSMMRGMANSAGLSHWFSTDTFSLDYSVYTPSQRALKGTYAGTHWDQAAFRAEMESARSRLPILEKPARKLERGDYRAYLAPASVADLVGMFNWGCVSEAAVRQGDSPLRLVRQGEKSFSPLFSLAEDFSGGESPRFNGEGELAPEKLAIIAGGKLENTLVSARTAKEYGAVSNGATSQEAMRAQSVSPGGLEESEILKKLGTGLYLSNLHYLNWSDQPAGRITGMTRYACFWVENGEIAAPIENMRWDDSIFTLFGSELEALTRTRAYLPDVGTYYMRQIGGAWMPGALVKKMQFTL